MKYTFRYNPPPRHFVSTYDFLSCLVFSSLIIIFSFLSGFSQSISPEVVAASGGYHQGTNAALSYTIGESITETFSGTKAILTQGFQQSLYTITSIDEIPDNNYHLSVYPNPAAESLTLFKGEGIKQSILSIELIDIKGKRLFKDHIEGTTKQIDLSKYVSSIYFIKVYDENNKLLKTFKIQKIN